MILEDEFSFLTYATPSQLSRSLAVRSGSPLTPCMGGSLMYHTRRITEREKNNTSLNKMLKTLYNLSDNTDGTRFRRGPL